MSIARASTVKKYHKEPAGAEDNYEDLFGESPRFVQDHLSEYGLLKNPHASRPTYSKGAHYWTVRNPMRTFVFVGIKKKGGGLGE